MASTLPSAATVARFGPQAERLFVQWRDLLATLAGRPEGEALKRVNLFFNRRILFAENSNIWNQADYWATPLETFGKGAGDCKSYAIGKYVSLRLLGMAPEKLRLVYVKAEMGGPASGLFEAHMVLTYYPAPTAEPLVLDNLVDSILPASQRPDLTPVFSFNMENIRVGNVQSENVNQLARWKQLLDKLKAEGFSF
ncbi:MAG: transglutaminase-like cysteine peptidase [Paludibacterium sp.]|nr:transglutaminase-like cysteine peptidase [Paludibacterium sp.]MBV8648898.1 transglutaminase-like cysteine peptidase [Paludibacterium sp.]